MSRIVAFALFAVMCGAALAAPQGPLVKANVAPVVELQQEMKHKIVPIINSEVNKLDDGSYDLRYESGDGTVREEKATLVNVGTKDEALEVNGSYKYINEKGEEVEVFYTAGKNGFVPYGSIINPDITAVAEAAKDLPKGNDQKEEEEEEERKRLAAKRPQTLAN